MTDLTKISCPKLCGGKAEQVINCETRTRKGWYCPGCGHFEKSVGRERKISG